MIGTKLVHYEITQHSGSGGIGDVYLATDARRLNWFEELKRLVPTN